jgi:tetratricopeptide (TPR) repeat protein
MSGCASTYSFTSIPAEAKVYYVDRENEKKYFLGNTPFQYKKSSLPDDKPFMVLFEKEGFIPTDVPVAPIDNARTIINVNLKKDPSGTANTANSQEIQETLRSLLKARNFIRQTKYHNAIMELDKVIIKNGNLPEAFELKGTAYYLLKDLNAAKEAWKQALKLDPNLEELQKFVKKNNIKLE